MGDLESLLLPPFGEGDGGGPSAGAGAGAVFGWLVNLNVKDAEQFCDDSRAGNWDGQRSDLSLALIADATSRYYARRLERLSNSSSSTISSSSSSSHALGAIFSAMRALFRESPPFASAQEISEKMPWLTRRACSDLVNSLHDEWILQRARELVCLTESYLVLLFNYFDCGGEKSRPAAAAAAACLSDSLIFLQDTDWGAAWPYFESCENPYHQSSAELKKLREELFFLQVLLATQMLFVQENTEMRKSLRELVSNAESQRQQGAKHFLKGVLAASECCCVGEEEEEEESFEEGGGSRKDFEQAMSPTEAGFPGCLDFLEVAMHATLENFQFLLMKEEEKKNKIDLDTVKRRAYLKILGLFIRALNVVDPRGLWVEENISVLCSLASHAFCNRGDLVRDFFSDENFVDLKILLESSVEFLKIDQRPALQLLSCLVGDEDGDDGDYVKNFFQSACGVEGKTYKFWKKLSASDQGVDWDWVWFDPEMSAGSVSILSSKCRGEFFGCSGKDEIVVRVEEEVVSWSEIIFSTCGKSSLEKEGKCSLLAALIRRQCPSSFLKSAPPAVLENFFERRKFSDLSLELLGAIFSQPPDLLDDFLENVLKVSESDWTFFFPKLKNWYMEFTNTDKEDARERIWKLELAGGLLQHLRRRSPALRRRWRQGEFFPILLNFCFGQLLPPPVSLWEKTVVAKALQSVCGHLGEFSQIFEIFLEKTFSGKLFNDEEELLVKQVFDCLVQDDGCCRRSERGALLAASYFCSHCSSMRKVSKTTAAAALQVLENYFCYNQNQNSEKAAALSEFFISEKLLKFGKALAIFPGNVQLLRFLATCLEREPAVFKQFLFGEPTFWDSLSRTLKEFLESCEVSEKRAALRLLKNLWQVNFFDFFGSSCSGKSLLQKFFSFDFESANSFFFGNFPGLRNLPEGFLEMHADLLTIFTVALFYDDAVLELFFGEGQGMSRWLCQFTEFVVLQDSESPLQALLFLQKKLRDFWVVAFASSASASNLILVLGQKDFLLSLQKVLQKSLLIVSDEKVLEYQEILEMKEVLASLFVSALYHFGKLFPREKFGEEVSKTTAQAMDLLLFENFERNSSPEKLRLHLLTAALLVQKQEQNSSSYAARVFQKHASETLRRVRATAAASEIGISQVCLALLQQHQHFEEPSKSSSSFLLAYSAHVKEILGPRETLQYGIFLIRRLLFSPSTPPPPPFGDFGELGLEDILQENEREKTTLLHTAAHHIDEEKNTDRKRLLLISLINPILNKLLHLFFPKQPNPSSHWLRFSTQEAKAYKAPVGTLITFYSQREESEPIEHAEGRVIGHQHIGQDLLYIIQPTTSFVEGNNCETKIKMSQLTAAFDQQAYGDFIKNSVTKCFIRNSLDNSSNDALTIGHLLELCNTIVTELDDQQELQEQEQHIYCIEHLLLLSTHTAVLHHQHHPSSSLDVLKAVQEVVQNAIDKTPPLDLHFMEYITSTLTHTAAAPPTFPLLTNSIAAATTTNSLLQLTKTNNNNHHHHTRNTKLLRIF